MPDYEAAVGKSVKGLRIGIPKEYRIDGMPAEIEKLWEQGSAWLKAAGAEMVEVSLPHTKYALPAYYIVAPAEASSNLARYDGVRYGLRVPGRDIIDMYEKTRAAGFGKEVRRRIMIGTYVLSAGYYDAYYLRAQKVRTLIKRDFEECFRSRRRRHADAGDAVGRLRRRREGRRRSGRDVSQRRVHGDGEHGRACRASRCRPASTRKGLPLGLQLIGRPFDEETLFSLGAGDRAGGRDALRPRAGGDAFRLGGQRSAADPGRRTRWSCRPDVPSLKMNNTVASATRPPMDQARQFRSRCSSTKISWLRNVPAAAAVPMDAAKPANSVQNGAIPRQARAGHALRRLQCTLQRGLSVAIVGRLRAHGPRGGTGTAVDRRRCSSWPAVIDGFEQIAERRSRHGDRPMVVTRGRRGSRDVGAPTWHGCLRRAGLKTATTCAEGDMTDSWQR